VQVWLDSLDTGEKIADCAIDNTGSLTTFQTFSAEVKPVTGQHDIYLKFTGTGTDKLFQLYTLYFTAEGDTTASGIKESEPVGRYGFGLGQNYPNPFNPSTRISFKIPVRAFVSLKVYNILGEEIAELAGKEFLSGKHSVLFDASHLASGIYFYTLRANKLTQTKKMFIIR
ncbi:carbohydrate-binding protein, partial [candidate division KSB1 bacterium]|nr:carbohydrate-binding protein [candidate division KSB1 bacterium]